MSTYLPELEWIEKQYTRLLEYVRIWSSINSFSTNLEGLDSLKAILKRDFSILGGVIESIPLPSRYIVDVKGHVVENRLGEALSIKKRPKAPLQILLAGHMDTVFSPSSDFQSIEKIDAHTWQGPGITDMKGGLAIILIALQALEKSPLAAKIGWEILINPDEELGSPGSAFLFSAAAKRNQLGMIFEPSFPDGAFVSQRKGSASYSVIVRGQAAHVGRDYSKGRSAIYALAEFIKEVENEQLSHPESIINVGHIEGGGAINTVADLAIARINFRSSDPNAIEKSGTMLNQIASNVALRDGITLKLVPGTVRFPKVFNPQTEQLFKAYAECANFLDQPFSMRETGGVCDGNILAHAGLPTMDSIGVIGGNMHTHQEYLILSSLVDRSKLAALFLFRLANGEFGYYDYINKRLSNESE